LTFKPSLSTYQSHHPCFFNLSFNRPFDDILEIVDPIEAFSFLAENPSDLANIVAGESSADLLKGALELQVFDHT
jgi:hypothetical protein